jgi:hypothetical protein
MCRKWFGTPISSMQRVAQGSDAPVSLLIDSNVPAMMSTLFASFRLLFQPPRSMIWAINLVLIFR